MKLRSTLIVTGLVLAPVLALAQQGPLICSGGDSCVSRIDQAAHTGAIDAETALFLKAIAVFEPERLPAAYVGSHAGGDATLILKELDRKWSQLSWFTQSRLRPYRRARGGNGRARRGGSGAATHNSARFCIEYRVGGKNGVDPTDSDGNNIPDFVDVVAATAEATVDQLMAFGFPEVPLYDSNFNHQQNGGKYLIKIQKLTQFYGYTQAEDIIGNRSDTAKNEDDVALTSIVISNFPTNAFFGEPINNAKLTTAHEVMHAILAGVEWGSDGWLDCLHEAFASWVEGLICPQYDVVTGDTDLFTSEGYLVDFRPDVSFHEADSHSFDMCYGSWHFAQWIEEHHPDGASAIYRIWCEAIGGNFPNSYPDVYAMLAAGLASTDGTWDLARTISTFAAANGGGFFFPMKTMPDPYRYAYFATGYLPVFDIASAINLTDQPVARNGSIPALASNYVSIDNASGGDFSVTVAFGGQTGQAGAYLLAALSSDPEVHVYELSAGQAMPVPANAISALVCVVNDGGPGGTVSYTVTVDPALDTEAPSVPGGLSASAAGQSTIDLTWTASGDNVGVDHYDIYRDGQLVASTAGTSYADTGLSADTTYRYEVEAFDATGNGSGKSASATATTDAPDTMAPTIPANLNASVQGSSRIELTWDASMDNVGVDHYEVYRNTVLVGSTSGTGFADTGLSASTTYTYEVEAFDAAGNPSGLSQAATATTDAGGVTGEGFKVSKNADFSTDDRSFTRSDTLYMMIYSDQIDVNDMRRARYTLKVGKKRYRANLTNHGDGTFTAAMPLASVRTGSATLKLEIQDQSRYKVTESVALTISP